LRLGGPIPARWLSTGSVVLLVCGLASGQNNRKSTSTIPDKSTARLRTVSAHTSTGKSKKSGKSAKNSRKRGQQKIDPARSREIQEALIREHYMDGTATGVWDARSQSAMERFQADNGWQSKSVPDSRALIKLGLGPDHEHLLNPESAMTSPPEPQRAAPVTNRTPAAAILPQK
jgi:peptidoglycan hydrolase-like protein with peptidoglycan-binding domain